MTESAKTALNDGTENIQQAGPPLVIRHKTRNQCTPLDGSECAGLESIDTRGQGRSEWPRFVVV